VANRAVCVGIDQFSDRTLPSLGGCENDARAVQGFLSKRAGWSSADLKTLLGSFATKDAILRALDWLRMMASPGDTSLFYMASYGSGLPGERGDAQDGLRQVLVAHDHHWQMNLLRDDDVAERLKRMPQGAATIVIIDAGHGGVVAPAPGAAVFGGPQLTRGRLVSPPDSLALQQARARGDAPRSRFLFPRGDDAEVVALVGCSGGEVPAEVRASEGARGAFTVALLEALGEGLSWEALVESVARRLSGTGQTPAAKIPDALRGAAALGGAAPLATTGPAQLTHGAPSHGAQSGMAGMAGISGMAGMAGISGMAGLAPSGAVDVALAQFKPDDYSVRLATAVCGVVPFALAPLAYRCVGEALPLLYPQATAETLARAQAIGSSDEVRAALSVVGLVDKADAGLAAFSGLKSVWGVIRGGGTAAIENDTEQGIDAALKLLMMGYFIYKLFPGGPVERVQMFYTTPAGQQMSIFYALVDVALPFADNVLMAGGNMLGGLISRHGSAAMARFGQVAGGEAAGAAQGVVGALVRPLEGVVSRVAPYASRAADTARAYLPGALGAADKIAGVVAAGADALPVYQYLGARAAAEAAVLRASRGG
jgi:hypothetical protein